MSWCTCPTYPDGQRDTWDPRCEMCRIHGTNRVPARVLAREIRRGVELPVGVVRECEQYSIDPGTVALRHDFAWQDPASGWVTQYCVSSFFDDTQQQLSMFGGPRQHLAEVARGVIKRQLEQKCGVEYALRNRYPLYIPNTCKGRYV